MALDTRQTVGTRSSFIVGILIGLSVMGVAWVVSLVKSDIDRLRDVSALLLRSPDHAMLAQDLRALYAKNQDLAISYDQQRWHDWVEVPPRLVALHPDRVYTNNSSAAASWRSSLGVTVVIAWSIEDGLWLGGLNVPDGKVTLIPPKPVIEKDD
jgi:hypothetical protein